MLSGDLIYCEVGCNKCDSRPGCKVHAKGSVRTVKHMSLMKASGRLGLCHGLCLHDTCRGSPGLFTSFGAFLSFTHVTMHVSVKNREESCDWKLKEEISSLISHVLRPKQKS